MSEQFENIRILKVRCKNHYLFGDMEFDFTNNGQPVDTIIIAGENGAGKSTLLNIIYSVLGFGHCYGEYEFDFQVDERKFTYYRQIYNGGSSNRFSEQVNIHLSSIYSDVAINYNKQQNITSVTNSNIDRATNSIKSSSDLAKEIEQLLIDIHDLDANDYYSEAREAKEKGLSTDNITLERRILRFTNAYQYMFGDKLIWKGIDNYNGKSVYFVNNNEQKIYLSQLSSGEKQIVFRGGYLLKDKNALKGATVLIDEPEISLHPEWQKKIMDYYKRIFTDENGVQTSQIFAVTHSPFIIHNENRYNDKVIILKKDENGRIYVEDNPSYYDCNSVKVVEDAFNVQDFSYNLAPTLYGEGRTDEKYIKKAAEIFGLNLPFEVKWIGHIDANEQESNTGYTALNKAKEFLIAQGGNAKTILLYDCDTNKKDENFGNIFTRHLPKYKNAKKINKGIENALILDAIDISTFYCSKSIFGDYGEEKILCEFDKMACCEYICNLDEAVLKGVFANIQNVLSNIINIFSEE